MNKIALIINPTSGKGDGQKFYNKIKNDGLINNKVDFYLTEEPLDAVKITESISGKYERIIIGGGDGTLHEAINGFNINSESLLGLLPIGSGNDFALSFHKSKKSPMELLQYYLSGTPDIREINFGKIEIIDSENNSFSRRMINSFGVGFDAKVAYYNQRDKTFSGTLSYIYSILKALFEFSRIDVKVNVDGKTFKKNALFCAVGNGKTIGGGLYLIPSAILDDNLLNLSVVNVKSRLKLLILFPKALTNSLLGRKELSEYFFRNVSLELISPFFVHVDGEIITDKAKIINVKISDKKIRMI